MRHKTIFVVDDNAINLSMAEEALEKQYRVITFLSAAKMFTVLKKVTPDMILLDIEMPEMNGYEAMKRLKSADLHSGIPVIFLTGLMDDASEALGIELGAVDFITKPFSRPVLLNRIEHHLHIDGLIRERTKKLNHLKNSIVFVLADIVENRDEGTGGHIERTTAYIEILVNTMIARGIYAEEISKMDLDSLISSARLHDVGKIAISDAILNKPGKLTDKEFAIMKTHAAEGERIIDQIVARTGDEEFLRNAKLFAGYHHERWDGSGYPYGLKKTDIPLQGRIMSIVDVYDALISERPYKKPFSHEESVRIIMECSGTQFDPVLADLFHAVRDQFVAVKQK